MSKITEFMMVTVDGYFEGTSPWSIEWHQVDEEFDEFSMDQLAQYDYLVFGRTTYEGMAQYWPSEEALRTDPGTAAKMNSSPKIVVSRTLGADQATWNNTRVVRDLKELEAIKQDGKAMLVLGSSVLTASLLDAGLLDELRVMVVPVALGAGSSFLHNPGSTHRLQLLGVRQFRNGNVLLTYAPRAA